MEKRKMTPAALKALADGDLGNFIAASTPGGIGRQEAEGQKQFVNSTTLPIDMLGCRDQLEEIGIKLGKPVDDLFLEATLPEGWKKEATDHSMWSKLMDERGRERAAIFYKAAFYDRNAFIRLTNRFSTYTEPVGGYVGNYHSRETRCIVKDCEEVVWESSDRLEPQPDNEESRIEWYAREDKLRETGRAWLDKNYPDWRDPTAHWD